MAVCAGGPDPCAQTRRNHSTRRFTMRRLETRMDTPAAFRGPHSGTLSRPWRASTAPIVAARRASHPGVSPAGGCCRDRSESPRGTPPVCRPRTASVRPRPASYRLRCTTRSRPANGSASKFHDVRAGLSGSDPGPQWSLDTMQPVQPSPLHADVPGLDGCLHDASA